MGMSAINQIFGHHMSWFPNSISGHITEMLMVNKIPGALWAAASITIILSVVLLIASNFMLKTKEMAD
ncbi:hypothetical protein JCM21714_4623 [Gracilibacillus boraciitolerans JCM 21714]|uniref:Uncharacterized protein n=2 Tax=Gracilibacillus boraciitolerans TaxID=307521 RepID=W4VPU9_9BACI|nr:hypothetical protein JCM21714_4623 [Gracilibacillus boraciitolerans JCM 21714]